MPTSLYRFYDAQDELLYVGITNSIPRRLEQHDETKPWFAEAARVTLEHHPDRVTALAAEKAAIKAERPKYNIVHNGAEVAAYPEPPLEIPRGPMRPSNGVTAARWNTNRVHTVGFLDRVREDRKFSELLAAAAEYFADKEAHHKEEPYLIRNVHYRMGADSGWIFEVDVMECPAADAEKPDEATVLHAEIFRAVSRLSRLERKYRPDDLEIPEGWPFKATAS